MSQVTSDTFLHPFHPASTLFFTSLSQLPLSCTVDPIYLNSFTFGTFVSSIFTVSSSFSPLIKSLTYLISSLFFPMHTSSISVSALLLLWSLCKSQYHLQTALSMVVSLLTSSVNLSIITANRNKFNADPWCSPTLTLKLSVVPIAHLTTVSLPSYISCTSHTYFSCGTLSLFLWNPVISFL